jgi:hypothetical protein
MGIHGHRAGGTYDDRVEAMRSGAPPAADELASAAARLAEVTTLLGEWLEPIDGVRGELDALGTRVQALANLLENPVLPTGRRKR